MQPVPFFSSIRSEKRWVNHIDRNYTKNLGIRPCIFHVPQSLRDVKPEAYTPQAVGLGPYHHLRPELQEMQSEKQASVEAFLDLKDKGLQKFTQFVKEEVPLMLDPKNGQRNSESIILPHYDRYLDLESKTLVWILVIDGIFLLQFLDDKEKWEDQRVVADIMMLENQIPLALLEKIREALKEKFPVVEVREAHKKKFDSEDVNCSEEARDEKNDGLDVILFNDFYSFCNQHSPLKLCQKSDLCAEVFLHEKHLLHYLYVLIVKNSTGEKQSAHGSVGQGVGPGCCPFNGLNMDEVKNFAMAVLHGINSGIQEAVAQGLKVPGTVSKLLEQLEKTADLYQSNSSGGNVNLQQHGLANKIDVPSVSQLYHIANINFDCTAGGIRNVLFDEKKNTLYLPEITLSGTYHEAILRNLVAYEAALKPAAGSNLELTEYVDLMCGILKAENDVKLLRQFGIIKGKMRDEEILGIFNGINKSTQIPDEQSEIQGTVQKLSKLIEVPSVSKLEGIGISFACMDGGKRTVLFDENAETLYLREIKIDAGDGWKNLTAYEVASKLAAGLNLELTEYVYLLCGFLKAENDVKLLRKFGIIKGDMRDKEIYCIFNGINKSTQIPDEQSEIRRTVQKLSNLAYPDQPRLANKIKVLSVSELKEIPISFSCTPGGKRNVVFDEKEKQLWLPKIIIDDKDGWKNLAANEAEYVDFMCAIIRNIVDMKILLEKSIIKGKLKEEEIYDAIKDVEKSIEWPSELSSVQKTVQKLNKKFGNIRIVKAYKFMKNSFATLQTWIIRLFPMLVLILLSVQSFCEIYGCSARRSGYAAVTARSSFSLDDSEAKLMMPRKVLGRP